MTRVLPTRDDLEQRLALLTHAAYAAAADGDLVEVEACRAEQDELLDQWARIGG